MIIKNMVEGIFAGNIPFIKVILSAGQSVQVPVFVLDTGFTGDLQVTPKIAKELNLQITGVTNVKIASGQIIQVATANAIASMEGISNYIQVLISNSIPLAGINFLSKFSYKAIVNCKYKTVALEKVY